jgi:hypothetical protein
VAPIIIWSITRARNISGKDAISGLTGVHAIADDLLIVGCSDTVEIAQRDHDSNLISLLNRCRVEGIHDLYTAFLLFHTLPVTVATGHCRKVFVKTEAD